MKYIERRNKVYQEVGDAIFFPGLNVAPKNYPKNGYPFRQDSHFLYFIGVNRPGVSAMIHPDGSTWLYGNPPSEADIVWEGARDSLECLAAASGLSGVKSTEQLVADVAALQGDGTRIHYLPPYRYDTLAWESELFRQPTSCVQNGFSRHLADAVVQLRLVKSSEEVAEIERAIDVSAQMYLRAFRETRAGKKEYEIKGLMEGVSLSRHCENAFAPIVTVHGEVLHNNCYENTLEDGQLLLIDTGVEIPPYCYGSDITRTVPVSGVFSEQQREIYAIVLAAQQRAIDTAGPNVSNKEVHIEAAVTIVEGLKALGIMKGDTMEAVETGAHTLLFPHGIGHMLGLDSHDMEDLGDFVAYPKGERPPVSAGLQNLRTGRQLKPGHVITVEPGIYFIPALMDRWMEERKHDSFINFSQLEKYRLFGGIRIEDDVLITETGCRVLGPGIPKSMKDIEAHMASEY